MMSSAAENGDSPRTSRQMAGLKGGNSEDKMTASEKFLASAPDSQTYFFPHHPSPETSPLASDLPSCSPRNTNSEVEQTRKLFGPRY